jgi:hypothetical protein
MFATWNSIPRWVFWALDFNVDPLCSLVVQKWRDEVRVLDEIVLRQGDNGASMRRIREEIRNAAGIRGGVWGRERNIDAHFGGFLGLSGDSGLFPWRGVRIRQNVPKSNPTVRDRVGTGERAALQCVGRREPDCVAAL